MFTVPPFTTLILSGFPEGGSLTLVIFTFMTSSGEQPGSPSKAVKIILVFPFWFSLNWTIRLVLVVLTAIRSEFWAIAVYSSVVLSTSENAFLMSITIGAASSVTLMSATGLSNVGQSLTGIIDKYTGISIWQIWSLTVIVVVRDPLSCWAILLKETTPWSLTVTELSAEFVWTLVYRIVLGGKSESETVAPIFRVGIATSSL